MATRIPLFEFVIRSTIAEFDLKTAEGRVFAMKAVAPVIAGIKDPALRPEYIRTVAGWLGIDEASLRQAVGKDKSTPKQNAPKQATTTGDLAIERLALKCVLQAPAAVGEWFDSLEDALFTAPVAADIYRACVAAGGPHQFADSRAWVQAVMAAAADEVASTVRQLAVEPLPVDSPDERYVHAVLARLLEVDAARRVAVIKADLQRADIDSGSEEQMELLAQLISLEEYRKTMQSYAIGDIQ